MTVDKAMKEQGRKQDWVALKLGITPSHFSRMKTGERPWTEDNKAAFLKLLDLAPDQVDFAAQDSAETVASLPDRTDASVVCRATDSHCSASDTPALPVVSCEIA